ncbi:MAG: ribosome biogenesis GTP-binding protein YihA/YsxC [Bdellovibrionota bacterium]
MSTIHIPSQEFIEQLKQKTLPLQMEYLSSGVKIPDLPPSTVPEFALVGRSNVGKSSLLNFIAGQKNLARVSNTPGRTQMINLFTAEKGKFIIADLPGYGYAESPQYTRVHWQQSMQNYFENREGLFSVFILMDMRRDIEEEDSNLSRWLQSIGLKVIGVQTKCDKVHKSKWGEVRKKQAIGLALSAEQMVTTSAEKKIGLNDVLKMMAGHLDTCGE